MYRHSDIVDTDQLLAERLAIAASEGAPAQNCATLSMKYVASQLGKDVTDQELTQLVSEPNKDTSFYAMKQFAQDLGLYCRAIKTNIQTLKNLNDCEVILHIPGKNHFVVLGGIDNEYVWIIDLASNKFYCRTDIDFFSMDWTEGTALLISNQSIHGSFTEIDDASLHSLIGASGYTCTRLLQEYNVDYCDYVGGQCEGDYRVYYTRYGCEPAESGSCSSSVMIRYKKSPYIEDPYYPEHCTVTGKWTVSQGKCPVNNFNRQFSAILAHAKIDEGEFHDLRRTCLTRWLSNGLSEYDVMNLAGHAKFETTRQFYLAVREDLLKHARAVSAEAMNGDFVAHLLRAPFRA